MPTQTEQKNDNKPHSGWDVKKNTASPQACIDVPCQMDGEGKLFMLEVALKNYYLAVVR